MNNYIKINIIFIVIILSIFGYSAIFSSDGAYPIQSMYKTDVISTGMSRAFSDTVRFNMSRAKEYNPYSIKIFIFFLSQLFLRILVLVLLLKNIFRKNYILFADILFSILLFLYGFGNIIIYQFTNLVVN